jgi:creatinine amidohydrolase/Fe(II)-dependent formamide hydrolase-like protein
MMALRPDLVRVDQIRDDPERDDKKLRGLYLSEDMFQRTDHGCVGYPTRASADKGRRLIDAAAGRVAEVVRTLLARPLPT